MSSENQCHCPAFQATLAILMRLSLHPLSLASSAWMGSDFAESEACCSQCPPKFLSCATPPRGNQGPATEPQEQCEETLLTI